jgi:hypothetical protein
MNESDLSGLRTALKDARALFKQRNELIHGRLFSGGRLVSNRTNVPVQQVPLRRIFLRALVLGLPLTLFGVLTTSAHSPNFVVVVGLIPSVLLFPHGIIPSSYGWIVFPLMQFVYYFMLVSIYFAFRTRENHHENH